MHGADECFLPGTENPRAADDERLRTSVCHRTFSGEFRSSILIDRPRFIGDRIETLFFSVKDIVTAEVHQRRGGVGQQSEAEISGNGTRCVAAYFCSEHAREKVTIRTGAGIKNCMLTSRNETQYEFEIAMGERKDSVWRRQSCLRGRRDRLPDTEMLHDRAADESRRAGDHHSHARSVAAAFRPPSWRNAAG